MDLDLLLKILLMVLIPMAFVALIMPAIMKMAFKINAVDVPRGTRHNHPKITPKLGGLGIVLGFLLGYMLFGTHSVQMNSILIASFFIVIIGIVDDIVELKPSTQFIVQLIVAIIVTVYGGIVLKDIDAFGIYINFGIFAYPLTIFFILGCINCINLIDGLDGLSGGISSIYFLTIGIISTMMGSIGLEFVLSFVMLGSTLGFLIHNFYPAKIFVGDIGSNFLGFIISIIALLGFKNVTFTSLIVPLLILAIPILDTLFAIIRRTLKGESISKGDSFHVHHQLLRMNLSVKQTVLVIYFVDILFAASSIIYVIGDRTLGYVIYGILFVIVVSFVMSTNVVFDKEYMKKKIMKKIDKAQ